MGGQHIKWDEEQGNRDAARPDLSRGDRLEQSSLCPRPRDWTARHKTQSSKRMENIGELAVIVAYDAEQKA
jgi:hypothetical protein